MLKLNALEALLFGVWRAGSAIFGVSSGYLRDKTNVKFMYQRNDRLGVTLPCNSKYHHQSYQGISLYLQAIAQFLQETCDQNCALIVNP